MNVTYWVILLFSITIGMWLMGFQSGIVNVMNKYSNNGYLDAQGNIDMTKIFTDMASSIATWNNLLVFGVFAIAAITSGLNLLAIIPLGAIVLILQFIAFPTTYMSDSGLPSEVTTPIIAFFTFIEIFIIFMLIRGNFK